jgi:hypothetical protein
VGYILCAYRTTVRNAIYISVLEGESYLNACGRKAWEVGGGNPYKIETGPGPGVPAWQVSVVNEGRGVHGGAAGLLCEVG